MKCLSRSAGLPSSRRLCVALLPLSLLASAPTVAVADIISISRSVILTDTTMPMTVDGVSPANFQFTVTPPPIPGPIFEHGEQHEYFDTWVTEFSLVTSLSAPTIFVPAAQDLGAISTTKTVNQGFTGPTLSALIAPKTQVVMAGIFVVDKYRSAVPEPQTWALMLAGLSVVAVGVRQRRPAASV